MVLSPSATSRLSPSSLGKPEPELASDELGKGDVVTTEVDDFVEWLVDRGCSNVDMKGNVDDCVVGIVDSWVGPGRLFDGWFGLPDSTVDMFKTILLTDALNNETNTCYKTKH